MNAELITALRTCARQTCCDNCPRYTDQDESAIACAERTLEDAADALEAADKRIDGLLKLVDINTERCEALRKQLRESHESYEKHINELEAQMPKEGEWIPVDDGTVYVKCSVCGEEMCCRGHYCPNCGARMRKGEEK